MDAGLIADVEVTVVAARGAADDRAHTIYAQARVRAEQVLVEKDALHSGLKPSNFEAQQRNIEAAWQKAEIALHAEMVSWVQAHGSEELRAQVGQALVAGRDANVEWRHDVPLDWGQAERLGALRSQIGTEWLSQNRPSWVVWQPLEDWERRDIASLREWDPNAELDERFYLTNPQVHEARHAPRESPDLSVTAPVRDLLSAARQAEPTARLATYSFHEQSGRAQTRDYFCASGTARLPGGYAPVQIVLRETERQAELLDAMTLEASGRDAELRTYAERLAAIVEIEFGKPLEPLEGDVFTGSLVRVDVGPELRRAIIVTERATHIVMLADSALERSVGSEIRVGGSGEQVILEARGEAVAVGREDLDGLQQQALRQLISDRARGGQRHMEVSDTARAFLHSAALRCELRLAECRRLDNPEREPDIVLELQRGLVVAARDSALATERAAWVAAHGSPELARASAAALAQQLRSEWLRKHTGWTEKTAEDVGWKRVAADGPNTLHPAATMSSVPAVKELMNSAASHAPDAILVAQRPAPEPSTRLAAVPPRPRHCAVITRRMPGSLEPEALFFRETTQQSAALDTAWGERHSVVHKLGVRMQREFGRPVAEHVVGETLRVEGKLAAIEHGEDNRHRAVIVNASHVHIVSVSPEARQQLELGKNVTLEKTAGRLRLLQAPERELSADRRQEEVRHRHEADHAGPKRSGAGGEVSRGKDHQISVRPSVRELDGLGAHPNDGLAAAARWHARGRDEQVRLFARELSGTLQQEFGRSCTPFPENATVRGKLVALDEFTRDCTLAAVLTDTQIHIFSVSSQQMREQLEPRLEQAVAIQSTAHGVRVLGVESPPRLQRMVPTLER